MPPEVQLIAIDLDGTLLDSHGRISDENIAAIQAARAQGVVVILATGKSRGSAEAIIQRLHLNTPGVYTQGLTIFDGSGTLLHSIALEPEITTIVLTFLETHNLPHIAHVGSRILVSADTPARHILHTKFHEPLPEIVGQLTAYLGRDHTLRINKLLVTDEINNDATRAALTDLVGSHATIVQAVAEFIEILPPHTSKGTGVAWLLNQLRIDPGRMLAIGDGENDIEMLQMAGIGVAMGNANPLTVAAADVQVATNDKSGVADAIRRFVLHS